MYTNSRNNQWVQSSNANSTLTLREIADAMNLTRERVRQIEAKALTKLRKKMQAKGIKASDLI